MSKKKVIIVGAGPGGLTAGMLLAKQGFNVEIFEKQNQVGGRNGSVDFDGFSVDAGPTFLMMKFLLDEIFELAGRRSQDYLDFVRLDPMYRLLFGDISIDMTDDHQEMRKRIAETFPGNEKGFDRFLEYEKQRFEKMIPCLRVPYQTPSSLFSKNLRRALPKLQLNKTVMDVNASYFNDERLQLAFSFQTKYLGMAPWNCPAAFMILPYIEHKFGVYHVQGGLCKISEAMAKVVEEEGGTIHLKTPIKQVILDGKKVTGVELESGEKVFADAVVMNADFAYAMTHLVPDSALRKYNKESLDKKQYSCSTFMLYLGVDQVYESIPHHTIVFSDDYRKNLDDIFERDIVPDDMSFYIRNSSVTDPTVAPDGQSQIYVLVPVPNMSADVDWDEVKDEYKDKVLKQIERKTPLKDLRQHIVSTRVVTPRNWQDDYNVYKGATFNLAHTLNQMLYFRPHNKFDELENCYIVGGGTHPGSGLPTIYESGNITSQLIVKDLG